MPYAATITGNERLLDQIAGSFTTATATIRKREDEWLLESDRFGRYDSNSSFNDDAFYETARELLSQIHSVLVLYMWLHDEPFSIIGFVKLNDHDEIVDRGNRFNILLRGHLPARLAFSPTASGSLATDLIGRTDTDPALKQALSLVGHTAVDWPRVYDIIEFLGGVHSIEKLGFAASPDTRRVRQTANRYRHLGNQKVSCLPSNAPTLDEAVEFAKGLLKQWIATRI
jgi:hypothetical protein